MTIIIDMKINGNYIKEEVTPNQVRRLEDSIIMGNRFINLGKRNYNISMIESWRTIEISDEERNTTLTRPKLKEQ